MSTFAASEDRV